jgi:hypothetical protein
MLKYFAALFILASGFCAAPLHRAPTPVLPPVDVEAERYAIYSLFLQHMFADEPVKLLVVKNQTSPDSYIKEEWDRMELEPRWQSVVDDYKAKNVQPAAVENKFKLSTPVTIISAQEVDQIFSEGGGWWQAFYKKYPKSPGLITFSNVGFNPEMTYALVDVGYSCGGLCGRGGLVLLVKKDGSWTTEKDLISWVS